MKMDNVYGRVSTNNLFTGEGMSTNYKYFALENYCHLMFLYEKKLDIMWVKKDLTNMSSIYSDE